MDRLPRSVIACGLGLLLAATGCRSTRVEVPPGRPFTKDGQQRPAIEFSSGGHPVSAAASANFTPNGNLGGSNMAAGIGSSTVRPEGANFGAPPGAYGPPGTAGMAQPGTSDPSTSRASTAPMAMPPAGMPPLDSPPATMPDLNVGPPPRLEGSEAPNPVVVPPADKPGTMGAPDQMPSPM
jgi:hypothetical protein